jgi:hypothetical protein
MEPAWLGYVLNTVSDIATEILMYWYGRLTMDHSSTKRKRARWLLVVEIVLTGFAWLFGWRQLLPLVTAHEGADAARWLAPLMAAFTPVALIGIGYAQSLLAGRIEKDKETQTAAEVAPKAPEAPKTLTRHARQAQLLTLWRQDPGATQDELAQRFDVSRQTISGDFAALAQAGKVRRNGSGVEVLV